MRFIVSLLALMVAMGISSFGQSSASAMGKADPSATGAPVQISGCLQGTAQEYRLVEKNGTSHLLIGDGHALEQHAGDIVTLDGYRDNNRDASASRDNGTEHGMRFFQVSGVATDNGKCK